jgi:hypothetical protein
VYIPSRPNWSCGDYTSAGLQVLLNNSDSSLLIGQNYSSNAVTSETFDSTTWQQAVVSFTPSSNVTTLTFQSLNTNRPCGPLLDSVTITPSAKGPDKNPRKSNSSLVITGSVFAGAAFICLLFLFCLVRNRRATVDYSRLYKLDEYTRVYTMKELRAATKNFTTILGEGGFGKVYKAEFPDGTMAAVKVEKPRGPDSSSSTTLASDEFSVLLRVHHRNLVNLIGYCIHKGMILKSTP